MKPLQITLASNKRLMVIPDTEAHLDGHPLITYTYSIFVDNGQPEPLQSSSKKDTLHLARHTDPNYRGEITFEMPGKLFNYHTEGYERLTAAEIREVIAELTVVRDDPGSWQNMESI